MTFQRCLVLFPLVLAAAGCGGGGGGGGGGGACELATSTPAADTTRAPSDVLDLHHFMLIEPVDASGNRTGVARTIDTTTLLGGYSSPWFYAASGGGVAFVAPLDGALTPDTPFPRSELREVINPADTEAAWPLAGNAQLTARVTVTRVPQGEPSVIVAKIIGHQRDATEHPSLLRLAFAINRATCRGSLEALVADEPSRTAPNRKLVVVADAFPLGVPFGFTVTVNSGTLTVSTGALQQSSVIDPRWNGWPAYFMAGAGLTSVGASDDRAAVVLHEIAISH